MDGWIVRETPGTAFFVLLIAAVACVYSICYMCDVDAGLPVAAFMCWSSK